MEISRHARPAWVSFAYPGLAGGVTELTVYWLKFSPVSASKIVSLLVEQRYKKEILLVYIICLQLHGDNDDDESDDD